MYRYTYVLYPIRAIYLLYVFVVFLTTCETSSSLYFPLGKKLHVKSFFYVPKPVDKVNANYILNIIYIYYMRRNAFKYLLCTRAGVHIYN
jgi:hypothetical protein